jgi:hypothetical protein
MLPLFRRDLINDPSLSNHSLIGLCENQVFTRLSKGEFNGKLNNVN